MRIGYESTNDVDKNGTPTGGTVKGVGFNISWQKGPLGRDKDRGIPVGAFVEDVIYAAKERIEFYNDSKFKCRQNSIAITKLEEALMWLENRTQERESRKVEGTHKK